LRELQTRHRPRCLFINHDLEVGRALALFMKRGKIAEAGSTERGMTRSVLDSRGMTVLGFVLNACQSEPTGASSERSFGIAECQSWSGFGNVDFVEIGMAFFASTAEGPVL
jgi:hypothetical protein